MTRLYVVDGNCLGHWLFHTNRTDDRGVERSTAQATKDWFQQFDDKLKPTHVVVCWDGKDNWRETEHSEYKASRATKRHGEEYERKIAELKTLPQAWADLGVLDLQYDGFEADDVIAALCNVHARPDCEVVIVSSDKDMAQLVSDRVKQYDPKPKKGTGECVFYDAEAVEKKFDVPPHRIADLLAIMGDSSDDVPGVSGWGKVSAVNAIRQTKSMAELIRKACRGELKRIAVKSQHRVGPPVDANGAPTQKDPPFSEQLVALELSRRLVSLRVDIPVPTDVNAFRVWRKAAA